MDKLSLSNILSGFSLTKINDNFNKIQDAINNTLLSRYGDSLQGDLDVNGKHLYNLPAPSEDSHPARLKDVRNAIAGIAAQTANLISFSPTSSVNATNIQGAVEAVASQVQQFGVSVKKYGAKGDGVTDDTAAIQAAIDAENIVYLPPGEFIFSTLSINKNNFTMYGSGFNRSILKTTADANVALKVATTANVSFLSLYDFKIQGNSNNLGGISLGSASFYCASPILRQVGVWDFSRAVGSNGFGIQLNAVQNVDISNCWIYRNRHGIQRPNIGYATSTHIHGKSGYLGEGYIGMYIDGQIDDIYVDDVVIEGNNNSGIVVTANAVLGQRGTSLYMDGVYLEANNATGAGVIYMTGGADAYQEHVLVLNRVNFAVNTEKYLTLDKVFATVRSSRLLPGQVSTTANTTVCFENNRYPNAGDYLAQYRALLGNITVRDTNTPYDDTYNNQVNLVNAVTFPNVARPITDPYTLDDYREGTWTPVLSSDGTAPTYTLMEPAEGTYTKIGNLVFCRAKLRVQMLAAGTGTPRVTGLPFTPKYGLEPPVVGLSTVLTNTSPNDDYLLSGKLVVFNGATYNLTNDGYLVFTITYQTA